MRIFTTIILLAVSAQAYGQDKFECDFDFTDKLAANDTSDIPEFPETCTCPVSDKQESLQDCNNESPDTDLVEMLLNKMASEFVDRAAKSGSSRPSDLDDTTLLKTHPDRALGKKIEWPKLIPPKKGLEETTVETTINIAKRLFGKTKERHKCFNQKRGPKAVNVLRKFVMKTMGTLDVRLDSKLNEVIWRRGIRNPPFKLRIRMSRRTENNGENWYVLVQHVPVATLKGLTTVKCE